MIIAFGSQQKPTWAGLELWWAPHLQHLWENHHNAIDLPSMCQVQRSQDILAGGLQTAGACVEGLKEQLHGTAGRIPHFNLSGSTFPHRWVQHSFQHWGRLQQYEWMSCDWFAGGLKGHIMWGCWFQDAFPKIHHALVNPDLISLRRHGCHWRTGHQTSGFSK